MFLMSENQIVGSGIVSGLPGKDVFHGDHIRQGVIFTVKFVLLPDTPLPFPNHHDDPPRLCLTQVRNQFALWGFRYMRQSKFSSHLLGVM